MDDIKSACLQKWSEGQELDERLIKFASNFDSWIAQIPEKNRETVLTLIKNTEYYSHQNVNKWLKELHGQLLHNASVNDENTIYVFLRSKLGKTNSSNDYWTEYKAINQLNKNICIENIDKLDIEDFKYIENIIYIDDFGGSGKSFITEIERYPEKLKGKSVYYITINIMFSAIKKIKKYCDDNGIIIVFLPAYKQEKAFKRNLFTDDERAKNEITEMSKDLSITKSFVLGFNKTQALVVFFNNTPNNTLGFIHDDSDNYKSIFPRRHDSKPGWMKLKEDRIKKGKTNYNNKKEGV